MSQLSLDQVMARADVLPALPQIVSRILEDLADENANVDSLAEKIASDPAVVARLLAAANAGAVGSSQRVASVRQATLLLGVTRVRAIVLATAVIDRYSRAGGPDSQRIWLHSLGVALCARIVAEQAGMDGETAYVAGLLHDIGQLLLYAIDPAAYAAVIARCTNGDIDIITAERADLGVDHAQVGGELARRWKLPNSVADAILGHHASDDEPPQSETADAVHVAEVLAHALDLGGEPSLRPYRVPMLSGLACARMGIDWNTFAEYFAQIEARFDNLRASISF